MFSGLKEPMEWAVTPTNSISGAEMNSFYSDHMAEVELVEELQDNVHQLYSTLVQVTEGLRPSSAKVQPLG